MSAAMLWRLHHEMCSRGFGIVDTFHGINGRRDGLMSCSELARRAGTFDLAARRRLG
jgi:hypothetical protein